MYSTHSKHELHSYNNNKKKSCQWPLDQSKTSLESPVHFHLPPGHWEGRVAAGTRIRAGRCSRVYRQGFPAARHSSAITVLPSATEKDLHQQLIHSVSAMCSLSKTAFPPLSYKHTQIFWAGNATQRPVAPSKSQLTIFQFHLPLFLLSLSCICQFAMFKKTSVH